MIFVLLLRFVFVVVMVMIFILNVVGRRMLVWNFGCENVGLLLLILVMFIIIRVGFKVCSWGFFEFVIWIKNLNLLNFFLFMEILDLRVLVFLEIVKNFLVFLLIILKINWVFLLVLLFLVVIIRGFLFIFRIRFFGREFLFKFLV